MGELGQSSDPGLPSYHAMGLELEEGVVELITAESSATGERHEGLSANVGEVAILAWGGEPDDAVNDYGGSVWMLPAEWMPYQKATFVTPAFAGYVSGHSGFSRAAAEVLSAMTGSPFFPGGLGSHTVPAGDLVFEAGPETAVTLEWATYYDAADQAGISRIYGGIHFACDDGPGRVIGSKCGLAALEKSAKYFDGSIVAENPVVELAGEGDEVRLEWAAIRGAFYKAQRSSNLRDWMDLSTARQAGDDRMNEDLGIAGGDRNFYRVIRGGASD